jgi:anaerobic ribonucleoside-triphosphate reductase
MKNKITKVKKRNGEIVEFDQQKITDAVFKAITATGQGDGIKSRRVSKRVVDILARRFKKDEIPEVEQIQDIVEEILILEGLVETARAYILYREQRRRIREAVTVVDESSERIDKYLKELDWQIYENANMTFSLQGLNQYAISDVSKKYWLNKIYPKEIREAAASEAIHIHDLESISTYCCGWDLYDLLKKGFRGVPAKLECRPPKHLRTALGQLVNFFYTLQGESAGAQAVSNFDTLMAPFIRYDGLSYPQVKQAMQEFLYNCMVPTRVGFQSLCWDELVVVKEKGEIKFKEIGELIDKEFEKNSHRVIEKHAQSYAIENHDDYSVLSFNEQGKAIWSKVKAFIRHKVPKDSEFVKVRTNRGEVKVSKAHSLFSFSDFNGGFNIEPKSSEDVKITRNYYDLSPDNHFIGLKSLDNQGNKEELNLIDIIDKTSHIDKNVFVKINPTRTLEGIRNNIFLEKQSLTPFYKEFGIKDRGVWQDWLEKKSIRYDIWHRYGDLNKEVEFKLKNSNLWYPKVLKGELLENFVKLCAWYITEGHTGISTPLYVSQSPSENSKEIIDILKQLNALGEISENDNYSQGKESFAKVLKITGKGLLSEIISRSCDCLAFNKVIPSFIFELSPKYQKIFLETLLKGDASQYNNHWDYATCSKKLSSSLSLLLAQNNYRFSVYLEKTSEKNKNWRDKWIIRIYKEGTKAKKSYFVNDFEARPCLKIEKFKYDKEYEYDISVDLAQENFVGGGGLLAFHNTPFLNLTLDIKPPNFLAKQPVLIGGKPQKETYGEFQEEINMLVKAFYEGLMEGDAKGRPFTFPIPTVSITKDFEWDNPYLEPLWEATAKYGVNYFQNFINSDLSPEDVRSMCCRLRLNNKELYMRGGGLFGSAPLTGSIGVVTVNLPRIGYLSKTKKEFFKRLAHMMDLAKESLEIKRKALNNFMEKGLYPYSKFYLESVKKIRGSHIGNHFSTIGLMGMNEALLNFLGENVGSRQGKKFALEILDFMRGKLVKYQKETGYLYNLEATPGEGTSFKQAKADKEDFPDIITAGTKKAPYYTNSSQLPVDHTDDAFKALKLQDDLQCRYTGGTVLHLFLGERIQDPGSAKALVKKVFEKFHLPYVTLTPTFSICPSHGYLTGEHFNCPKCTIEQPCEVYSRIVGYIRPVNQWHIGKKQEFKERKEFKVSDKKNRKK